MMLNNIFSKMSSTLGLQTLFKPLSSEVRLPSSDSQSFYHSESLRHLGQSVAGLANSGQTQRVAPVKGIQRDGSFVATVHPKDLGRERWSSDIEPRDVARIVARQVVDQIPSRLSAEAKQDLVERLARNGLETPQESGSGRRAMTKADLGSAGYLKNKVYAGSLQVLVSAQGVQEIRCQMRVAEIQNPSPSAAVETIGGVLPATTLALPKLLELPDVVGQTKELVKAGGAVAGEALPVALPIAAGAAAQAYTVKQMHDAARERWANEQTQIVLPISVSANSDVMENGEEPKSGARPTQTAEPQRMPGMPIPDAPTGETGLTVRPPQAVPSKGQKEVENAPESSIGIERLPQPDIGDVSGRQTAPNAPRPPSKDLTPPIVGTVTTLIGIKSSEEISSPSRIADLKQVAYGTTELSAEAIRFRKENKIWSNVNVAVFKYLDADGNVKMKAMTSDRATNKHSEQRLDSWLESQGIPRNNVVEIYSELAPCVPKMPQNCDKMLAEKYPQAKVTYSYEYGATRDSRERGVQARGKDLKELKDEN